MRRVGVIPYAAAHATDATPDGGEVFACWLDEFGRRDPGPVERLPRHLDIQRLAVRRSLVRLEAVAESSVGVLVAAQRFRDRIGRAAFKDRFENAPLKHSPLTMDELDGSFGVFASHELIVAPKP
jgi:hypothetical protein